MSVDHLKPHWFQKGHPGGPGRPKGTTITDQLRKLIEKPDANGRTMAEVLAQKAIDKAEEGDFRFWNALVDRIDGPVVKRIAVEDAHDRASKIRDALIATADGMIGQEGGEPSEATPNQE